MDDENMVKKKITESDKVVKTKIEMIIKGSKDKKSKAIDFLVDLGNFVFDHLYFH